MSEPSVNGRFELSCSEAQSLWQSSLTLESDGPDTGTELRRSECGKWAVRSFRNEDPDEKMWASERVVLASTQLERLKRFGLSVVTYAMTATDDQKRVYTVSPWIMEADKCPESLYQSVIEPTLNAFYACGDQSSRVLHDIRKAEQFSVLPNDRQVPFLHDIDPHLASSHYTLLCDL